MMTPEQFEARLLYEAIAELERERMNEAIIPRMRPEDAFIVVPWPAGKPPPADGTPLSVNWYGVTEVVVNHERGHDEAAEKGMLDLLQDGIRLTYEAMERQPPAIAERPPKRRAMGRGAKERRKSRRAMEKATRKAQRRKR